MINLLGVELSPAEYNEYWNRVHRGSKTPDVSFEQVLTYYGNLLDAEILGKSTMREGIHDVNRIFRTGDQSLIAPDATEMGYLLQVFSNELSQIKKEKNMKDYEIFKAFDQDKNQRISLTEFKLVSERLGVKTSPADLDKIYMYLDKNNSNSVDLAELFKVLNFDIEEYYRKEAMSRSTSDLNNPANWKTEKIIEEFMKKVESYMRRTGSSIYQIYALMDKQPDSLVTKVEIKKFIVEKMGVDDLPEKHYTTILNAVDKSGDNKISMKEFVEFLKLREVYRMVNSEKDRQEMRDLVVLNELYNLMYKTEKTPTDLVMEMDDDKNGTIDHIELAFYIKKLRPDIASHDIDRFMHYVDKDASNSLSLKEVENTLQAYILLMDGERDVPPEKIEALLKKVIPIIDNNKEKLKDVMKYQEELNHPGFIREENLKSILTRSALFTEAEVDLILNPLCKPFTTFKKIRYMNLFDLKKQYSQHLKMKESGLGVRRGRMLVDQLFKVLKRVGKKHHLNEYELFQCFDTDDSGTVTLIEMK